MKFIFILIFISCQNQKATNLDTDSFFNILKILQEKENINAYIPLENGIYYKKNNKIFFNVQKVIRMNQTEKDLLVPVSDFKTFRGFYNDQNDGRRCDYAIDKDYFYFKNIRLSYNLVDFETMEFKCLTYENNFLKDKNSVYYVSDKIRKIKDSDVKSFKYINHTFAKDKKYLYYLNKKSKNYEQIKKLNINNLKILNTDIIKDNKNAYCIKSHQNIIKLDTVFDPKHLAKLKNYNNYYKDQKYLYKIKSCKVRVFKDISLDDFKELDSHFIKNRENIYYIKYQNMENFNIADSLTFQKFGNSYSIYKDKTHIYKENKIYKNIDSQTFRQIKSTHFYKDKNNIYNSYLKIIDKSKIDIDSFVSLNNQMFKDRFHVFYYDWYNLRIVPDATPDTFLLFCPDCTRGDDGHNIFDKIEKEKYNSVNRLKYRVINNKIFYLDKKIKNVDFKTFQVLNNYLNLSKDKDNIFFKENIHQSDLKSFKELDYSFMRDKNHIYSAKSGKIIFNNIDTKSFKILDHGYYIKDNQGIYTLNGKKFDINTSIDLKSIELLYDYKNYLKDKDSVYYVDLVKNKIIKLDLNLRKLNVIDNELIADDKKIYFFGNKITSILYPDKFQFVHTKSFYATDGAYIYFVDNSHKKIKKVVGVDLESFKSTRKLYGEDKNFRYYVGIKNGKIK